MYFKLTWSKNQIVFPSTILTSFKVGCTLVLINSIASDSRKVYPVGI